MQVNINFWSYLAQICLEWQMFRTTVVQKIKTHILFSMTYFFGKSCRLWDNVEKYCTAGQATDDNMAHAHCLLDTYGYKYTLIIFNTYFFPLQQWLNERASMLHYTYIACLVNSLLFRLILECLYELYHFRDPKISVNGKWSVTSENTQWLSKHGASCMTSHDFYATCTEFVNSHSQTTVMRRLVLY